MSRLKVVTEVDASALIRVLQLFDMPNVVPLRVSAQRVPVRGTTMELLEIEIDLATANLAPDAIRVIAAKIKRLGAVLTTVVCD